MIQAKWGWWGADWWKGGWDAREWMVHRNIRNYWYIMDRAGIGEDAEGVPYDRR